MKKLLLLSALFISFLTFAQVPQGISYQAIALNGSGTPVVSSNVRVKLSILDTSATGTVLYSETQLKTTNAQGLFNLVIGQGTVVSGVFATISWGTNSKFLKVEMDATGGTTYAPVGTAQLLSVPYAMFAGSVASIPSSAVSGIGTNSLKTSNFIITDGSSVKGFYNGVWSTQTFSSFVDNSQVTASNGNFVITDGSTVKGFYNGVWSTQTFSSFVDNSQVTASNGNFVITDGSTVKGFYNGVWSTQTFSSFVDNSQVTASNGNYVITDSSTVKGLYNGVWTTQTFSSFVDNSQVTASNGNFVITDGSTVKGFYNGVWTTQSFSSFVDNSQVSISEKN